ncbi:hypothetical protein AB4129_14210 [Vibrio cyclitrophicus]
MTSLLLFFGVLSSQFYLFSSGVPQPSHFIITAFIFIVFIKSVKLRRYSFFTYFKPSFFLYSFVAYIIVLNISFSIYYQSFDFLTDVIFSVFNILLFTTVTIFLVKNTYEYNRVFIVYLSFLSVLVLFLICTLGFSRQNFGIRYNGLFNDPNQMSYWVICVYAIFITFSNRLRFDFLLLCLSVYIIYLSESRSGMLAISFFVISLLIKLYSGFKVKRYRYILASISIALLCSSIFYLKGVNSNQKNIGLPNSDKVSSLQNRVLNTDIESQLRIRGYMRPFDYPEFLFFGAGKGLDERFNSTVEIHSSWVGLLFYYGIIGFFLFLGVYFYYISISDWYMKFCMLAPLFYGISTYGLRTPIFWFFLAVTIYSILYKRKISSDHFYSNENSIN